MDSLLLNTPTSPRTRPWVSSSPFSLPPLPRSPSYCIFFYLQFFVTNSLDTTVESFRVARNSIFSCCRQSSRLVLYNRYFLVHLCRSVASLALGN